MISKVLLLFSVGLILFSYVRLLIIYFKNKNKCYDETASDVVNDLLGSDVINVIEVKELIFSKYNIRRRMVKLSSNIYDSSNYFSHSIASLMAGYAMINSKYLKIIGYVFKEIKFITFSPLIAIVVSFFTTNIGDAKLAIFVLGVIVIYQYLLIMVNNEAVFRVKDLNKKLGGILNVILNTYTLFFVASLIQIVRLVVIFIKL